MSATYNPNPKGARPQNPRDTRPEEGAKAQDEQVAIDGFKQVLELLRIADPAFRESLLRRLAAKDRDLARSLRQDLEAGL